MAILWVETRESKYLKGKWRRANGRLYDCVKAEPWFLDSFLKEVIASVNKMGKWIRKIKAVELEGVLRKLVKAVWEGVWDMG